VIHFFGHGWPTAVLLCVIFVMAWQLLQMGHGNEKNLRRCWVAGRIGFDWLPERGFAIESRFAAKNIVAGIFREHL
jgi:hypothetical protein